MFAHRVTNVSISEGRLSRITWRSWPSLKASDSHARESLRLSSIMTSMCDAMSPPAGKDALMMRDRMTPP